MDPLPTVAVIVFAIRRRGPKTPRETQIPGKCPRKCPCSTLPTAISQWWSRHGRACLPRFGRASGRWSRRVGEAVRRMAGTCDTNLDGLLRVRARKLAAVFLQDASRPTPMGAASRMARSRRINLAASPSVRGAEIEKRRTEGGGVAVKTDRPAETPRSLCACGRRLRNLFLPVPAIPADQRSGFRRELQRWQALASRHHRLELPAELRRRYAKDGAEHPRKMALRREPEIDGDF